MQQTCAWCWISDDVARVSTQIKVNNHITGIELKSKLPDTDTHTNLIEMNWIITWANSDPTWQLYPIFSAIKASASSTFLLLKPGSFSPPRSWREGMWCHFQWLPMIKCLPWITYTYISTVCQAIFWGTRIQMIWSSNECLVFTKVCRHITWY